MITAFALAFALAAMIAPRKLQSFAAAVQAVAPAASSVLSTANIVGSGKTRLADMGTVRAIAVGVLDELEDAL
jgi:hypothetical protein